MAKKGITRQRMGQMIQELFRVLQEQPDGVTAKDAIDIVASRLDLTEHEKGEYENGWRRFDKILRFGTVDAVKAGWMQKEKGVWTLTPEGQEALRALPEPADFYREASRLYWKWKRAERGAPENPEEPDHAVEAKVTFEEAEESAWKEIAAYLESIDPYRLQDWLRLCWRPWGTTCLGSHLRARTEAWTSWPGQIPLAPSRPASRFR